MLRVPPNPFRFPLLSFIVPQDRRLAGLVHQAMKRLTLVRLELVAHRLRQARRNGECSIMDESVRHIAMLLAK